VSWTTPSALPSGDYRVRARTKADFGDGTDTTSAWTSNLAFTVDASAPSTPAVTSSTHPRGYNEANGAITTVPGDKASGTFTLASTDTRIAGYAYAFNNSTVPAYTGANCLTAAGTSTSDGTQGFIKASGGTAILALPAAVTGTSYLRVKAIDEAGNASSVAGSYHFMRPSTTTSFKNFTLTDAVTGSGNGTWTVDNQADVPDGSQLYAASPSVNSRYTVNFSVSTAGTWQLEPLMVRAASHGKVKFAVDNVPVGVTQYDPLTFVPYVVPVEKNLSLTPGGSFYSAEVIPINVSLSVGTHTLSVISVGPGSGGGTTFSLDALRLIKTG
jgi:hypothetical protein